MAHYDRKAGYALGKAIGEVLSSRKEIITAPKETANIVTTGHDSPATDEPKKQSLPKPVR